LQLQDTTKLVQKNYQNTVELEKQLLVLNNERDLLTSEKNSKDSELTKCIQDLSDATSSIQERNSQVENYHQQMDDLKLSLNAVKIVAESVPELKTSLLKSIADSEKYRQELAQLKSNVEASAESLEVKNKELLALKKKVSSVNQNYSRLLANQNEKIIKAKDSAIKVFVKELQDCVSSIQTGSSQLNGEFKNAYENLIETDCTLTDFFALIQELLTFINDQNSSRVTELEKQLNEKECSVSEYEKGLVKIKLLNNDLQKDLSTKLLEVKDLKSKIVLNQKTKRDVENSQKRLIQTYNDEKESMEKHLKAISQELAVLKLSYTSAKATIGDLSNEKISLANQVALENGENAVLQVKSRNDSNEIIFLKSLLTEKEDSVTSLLNSIAEAKAELLSTESAINEMKNVMKTKDESYRILSDVVTKTKAELLSSTETLSNTKTKMSKAISDLETTNATTISNLSLDFREQKACLIDSISVLTGEKLQLENRISNQLQHDKEKERRLNVFIH
jgi:chromosome segregation ATPase